MTPIELKAMCEEVASSIYGTRRPTEAYAERTARLLFMTAAHEGHLKWRRQLSFVGATGARAWKGAFGLWQIEAGSVADSLRYLMGRRDVLARCCALLEQHGSKVTLSPLSVHAILEAMTLPSGDIVSCLFARLHYLRVPASIPDAPEEQAAYAKRYYNTPKGKATAQVYLEDFHRYWPE
jgi:hypothetical protein